MEEISLKSGNIYNYPLLKNIHLAIPPPTPSGKTLITEGNFTYYHYKCDGYDDIGWGCAYRTLQSTCSWILNNLSNKKVPVPDITNSTEETMVIPTNIEDEKEIMDVPSIPEIQQTLISIADKPESFLDSKDWIGALEVFYVIDTRYDVPCKILHIPQCDELKKYSNIVKKYFEDYGGLIMMGGDIDASSKGIAGIHISGNQAYFLVIDPHFVGKPKSVQELIEKGYIRWQHTSQFMDSSFYNLCLPQLKAKTSF